MTISLVDLSSRPVLPDTDALTIRTTCTNRDLPSRLPFGNEAGRFRTGDQFGREADCRAEKAHQHASPADGPQRPVAADLASVAELSFAGGRRARRLCRRS